MCVVDGDRENKKPRKRGGSMKITYIKKVNYFDKNGKIKQSQEVDRQQFDDLTFAINYLKDLELHFVDNPKGVSVYEEAKLIYRKDNFNYICFNKTIDHNTKEVVSNV